ncbi:hypothetical protein [Sediminispirochaeta bajacaliforniensis]|uniref:hypothetical protein n=1 Tax=Sediminispirochaeta bajacaliforniensis TaxID=148 RepID=UPI00035E36F7|nr:hypothetical protein [Sediminispirochaeta bajacaliforniensis]
MNKIMNLAPEDYYTQRNNPFVYGDNPRIDGEKDYLLKANAQCMPTAYVMFLIGNKIPYTNLTRLPDDAYFSSLLITKAAWEFAAKKYSWSINRKDKKGNILPDIPPNEIHGMYGSYLSKIVCGRRVSDFMTDLTFDDYVDRIDTGQVIMTSGSFPGIDGHAFDAVGRVKRDSAISLKLADPWGDFKTGYKNHSGYNVSMTQENFLRHVKPVGKLYKWGHIVL